MRNGMMIVDGSAVRWKRAREGGAQKEMDGGIIGHFAARVFAWPKK